MYIQNQCKIILSQLEVSKKQETLTKLLSYKRAPVPKNILKQVFKNRK